MASTLGSTLRKQKAKINFHRKQDSYHKTYNVQYFLKSKTNIFRILILPYKQKFYHKVNQLVIGCELGEAFDLEEA